MVDNLSESADDVKYNIDVKYNKNLYPVFMKKIAKRMKLESRDGLKKDRYKTAK